MSPTSLVKLVGTVMNKYRLGIVVCITLFCCFSVKAQILNSVDFSLTKEDPSWGSNSTQLLFDSSSGDQIIVYSSFIDSISTLNISIFNPCYPAKNRDFAMSFHSKYDIQNLDAILDMKGHLFVGYLGNTRFLFKKNTFEFRFIKVDLSTMKCETIKTDPQNLFNNPTNIWLPKIDIELIKGQIICALSRNFTLICIKLSTQLNLLESNTYSLIVSNNTSGLAINCHISNSHDGPVVLMSLVNSDGFYKLYLEKPTLFFYKYDMGLSTIRCFGNHPTNPAFSFPTSNNKQLVIGKLDNLPKVTLLESKYINNTYSSGYFFQYGNILYLENYTNEDSLQFTLNKFIDNRLVSSYWTKMGSGWGGYSIADPCKKSFSGLTKLSYKSLKIRTWDMEHDTVWGSSRFDFDITTTEITLDHEIQPITVKPFPFLIISDTLTFRPITINKTYKLSGYIAENKDFLHDTIVCNAKQLTMNNNEIRDASCNWMWTDSTRTENFTVAKSGKYWIEYAKDNCMQTDTFEVLFTPEFQDSIQEVYTLCDNDSLMLPISPANRFNLLWSGNKSENLSGKWLKKPGTYYLYFSGKADCGLIKSFEIINIPKPVILLSDSNWICEDAKHKIAFTLQNGHSYDWNLNPILVEKDTLYCTGIVSDTMLFIEATLGKCSFRDTAVIRLRRVPDSLAILSMPSHICTGDTVQLTAAYDTGFSDYDLVWNTGEESQTIRFAAETFSSHYYHLTGICGKYQSDILPLSALSKPLAKFSVSPKGIHFQDSSYYLLNESRAADAFLWMYDSTKIEFTQTGAFRFNDTGYFCLQLVASNLNDCFDSVSHCYKVNAYTEILLPNAFSPNGDGINDTWYLPYTLHVNEMLVFNRWGQQLATIHGNEWDGRHQGQIVPQGVYLILLDYTDQFGFRKWATVNVTVVGE